MTREQEKAMFAKLNQERGRNQKQQYQWDQERVLPPKPTLQEVLDYMSKSEDYLTEQELDRRHFKVIADKMAKQKTDCFVKTSSGYKLKLVRAGSEFGNPSRGGTWYEVVIYEGMRPRYRSGNGFMTPYGVGGKDVWNKEIVLKHPYMLDITKAKNEAEYPLLLYEDVFKKKALRKGLMGSKAEKYYSKIERAVVDELNDTFDGVVFYHDIGGYLTPVQAFIFRRDEDGKKKS